MSKEEFKQSYYNKEHINIRKSGVILFKRISEFINKDDTVLDVGAYYNDQLNYLHLNNKSQYYPIDLNKFTSTTIQINVSKEKLPFGDNFFDKIIFSQTLEHLDNPVFALKEVKRVLKGNGKLILVVPNCDSMVKAINSIIYEDKYVKRSNKEHCNGYGTDEICSLLGRTKFNIIHFEKNNPEIVTLKVILPNWRIFKLFTSNILVIANKKCKKSKQEKKTKGFQIKGARLK